MTTWTEGYVADIPYALGFYRETVPAHIAFAALSVGKHPGLSISPRRVLELGIGMGLGFVINAASNPGTHFEGVDFNPLHIAHARGLVDGSELCNVTLREASFQDLAREAAEGQHDLDLIVLHGILTWVSAEAQEAIVEIARKRLRPGGLLYVSYNCMPGWAPMLPMQRLMRENAKRIASRSDVQTDAGLKLVKSLIDEKAFYFVANSALEQRIDRLLPMDRNYLAHEYLNANWFIFHFADVAEMFSRAKLSFVGSATLVENMDGLSVPEGVRSRISSEVDPIFKETLRDIAGNKQFRRDIFARGVSQTTTIEQNKLLGQTRFALAIPRRNLTLKIPSPLGDLDGSPELYNTVADRLALKPATLFEIAGLPCFADRGVGVALQVLGLLVHSSQALPLPSGEPFDPRPAQRLNLMLAEKVSEGRAYSFVAAPVAGSGLQVNIIDLLMLDSVRKREDESESSLADDIKTKMRNLNINWTDGGKLLADPDSSWTRTQNEARDFIQEKLPLWRQLGVLS